MTGYGIREIASGMGFIEGPVACDDGTVLLVDVTSGWILRVNPSTGAIERVAETRGGPNGLALGPNGQMFVCNNGGMASTISEDGFNTPLGDGTAAPNPSNPGIQVVDKDGSVRDLYLSCNGEALSAPNDLVFDAEGGFYFTDLGHPKERHCDLGGLYYALPDGSSVIELIHEVGPATPLTQPNGVALSPCGKRVYVAETAAGRIWAWDIAAPGVLAPSPKAVSLNGGELIFGYSDYTLFDSMAVDGDGNICVATLLKGGITVITPDGKLLEFIELPEFDPYVTNICFGGPDLRTAYVTAAGRGKLWAIDWPRPGLKLAY